MLTINKQPTSNNNTLTNNLTNPDPIINYIQKINDALHHNEKELPIADRMISDVRYRSNQKNYDPHQVLLHIRNMMLDFLSRKNFFNKDIIIVDSKYYKLNMQLDDLTKQIGIIEQEVNNYIKKFPYMIKTSLYYKEIANSFFAPIDYIEKKIAPEHKIGEIYIFTDLINAINLVKDHNKLLPQKKILEEKIYNFIEYSHQTEVTRDQINNLIHDLFSDSNIKLATFYPDIYNQIFNLFQHITNTCKTDLAAIEYSFKNSCTRYEEKNDTEEKKNERLKYANIIYRRINKLDNNILKKIYNIKERATILKQAIAQN
jgi:hypothetical protein